MAPPTETSGLYGRPRIGASTHPRCTHDPHAPQYIIVRPIASTARPLVPHPPHTRSSSDTFGKSYNQLFPPLSPTQASIMAGFTSMNRVKTEESEAEITNGIPPRAEPVHSSSNGHSANGPNGHAQIPPALKEEDSNDTSDTSAASSPETITQDTKPAPAPPLPPPQQQPPAPSTLQTAAPPQPHYDPHIDPMIAGLAGTNNPAQQSSASPPQPAKRATEEPSDQRLKVAKLEHQYVPRSPAGSPSTSPQMYNMSPQQYYMGGQPPPPPPPGAYSNDSNSNHSPRHHHHPHPQTIPATHVMGNPILPQYASPQGSQHPYNPFLYPQSRSRANPPLDMGSVDGRGTTKQRFEAGSSTRSDSRFKLEHVPTVYPTLEDFENRPKYMETLERYYGKYGMVKIVPPERWNVHFRLDTEVSKNLTEAHT